eukprot:comp22685_c1_seq1/m.35103 comp22685_c1_seq1/g.35103  ORF comp22685_c1_seq1/g.35103 comp22685_c1_seq1/m.35103 type:complete len:546 (-) comp22685_c1_seq1:106-1743(-)
MALRIPQAGFAAMMKDGAKSYSGLEEAVYRNINACKELTQIIRTSLGPNGMNKMIINHVERLFVTNDAATMIKEIDVQHPAAKILVFATQQQEQEIGDATGLTMIFAGELLEQAEPLLRMGLHPSEVISGYEKACAKALEILEELEVYKLTDVRDVVLVEQCLRPVVQSKQQGYEDVLTKAVAEACISIMPKNPSNFNVDNIRVAKMLGGGIGQTTWLKGMVFKRAVESNITHVKKAKIAVFSGPLDTARTETKGTVLIKNAQELLNFSNEEEAILESQIKQVADSGVNVVVTGSTVGDLALNFCNKYNLMVVRIQSKFDLRRLCKAIGATALARMGAPTPEEMGYCDDVRVTEIGDQDVTVFSQEEEGSQVATILVRGATDNAMDDVERAIDDAVNVFKQICKEPRFVAGAGACELELARRVQQFGETCPGLDQYAIKNFGKALEIVPRILATNAGVNATELVSKLYAAHQAGKINMGFDINGEGVAMVDAAEMKVLDLLRGKHWAFRLATHAANTVLSVDQIIMAKASGGPKARKNPDWDEDR